MRDLTATGQKAAKNQTSKPVIKKVKVANLEVKKRTEIKTDAKPLEYEVDGPAGSENVENETIIESDEPSEAIPMAEGKKLEELEDVEETQDILEAVTGEPPVLLFKNPTFKDGSNVTFRKGPKWSRYGIKRGDRLNIAKTPEEGEIVGTCCSATVQHISGPRFLSNFGQSTLDLAHEPSCRTREGLVKEMIRVYGEFDPEKDIVVMIQFVINK